MVHGADKTIISPDNKTAADMATKEGHHNIAALINNWKGNYGPKERPTQQLVLMTKNDREDQVKIILEQTKVDLDAELTMVGNNCITFY